MFRIIDTIRASFGSGGPLGGVQIESDRGGDGHRMLTR
jgi:hypothetical protein